MTLCSFVYTREGLRIPDSSVLIEVSIGGVLRTLRLVRSGKGRSRIDRWSDRPLDYGVVGEINTRDLKEWIESGEISHYNARYVMPDGETIHDIELDLDGLTGRKGREKSAEDLLEHIRRYTLESKEGSMADNWMLDAVLRYAPYGVENTEDFRDVIDAVLPSGYTPPFPFLTPVDLVEKIKDGALNFLLHCSDEVLQNIVSLPGVVTAVLSNPESSEAVKERVGSEERISRGLKELIDRGDPGDLLKTNALSLSEIMRIASYPTWRFIDSVSGVTDKAVDEYIKTCETVGPEHVVLAGAALKSGTPLSSESLAKISDFLSSQPASYVKFLSDLKARSGLSFRNGEAEPRAMRTTKALLESLVEKHPAAIAALGTHVLSARRSRWGTGYYDSTEQAVMDALSAVSLSLMSAGLTPSGAALSEEQTTCAAVGVLVSSGESGVNTSHDLISAGLNAVNDESLIRTIRGLPRHRILEIARDGKEHRELGGRSRALLLVALSSGYEEIALEYSQKCRPKSGVDCSGSFLAKNQTEASQWLEALANRIVAFNENMQDYENGSLGIPMGRWYAGQMFEISEPRDLSGSLPGSVALELSHERATMAVGIAASIIKGAREDIVRSITGETSAIYGDLSPSKENRGLFGLFSSDNWSENWWDSRAVVPDETMLYGTKDLDYKKSATRRERVGAFHAARAGVALGTSNLEILTSMLQNASDWVAGPIAAMRIIGHPDVPPLDGKIDEKLVREARNKLAEFNNRQHNWSSVVVCRTVGMAKSLLSGLGLMS